MSTRLVPSVWKTRQVGKSCLVPSLLCNFVGPSVQWGEVLCWVPARGASPARRPAESLVTPSSLLAVVAIVFGVLHFHGCCGLFGINMYFCTCTDLVHSYLFLDNRVSLKVRVRRPFRQAASKNLSSGSSTRTIMLLKRDKGLLRGSP